MEQPRIPKDATDIAPSSSPQIQSTEHEAVDSELTLANLSPSFPSTDPDPCILRKNTNAFTDTYDENHTIAPQNGEETELRTAVQMHPLVGADPSPQSSSNMQFSGSNGVYEEDDRVPLLSPFVAVKNEQSSLSKTTETQLALNCLPSSPVVPPTSSDPANCAFPFASDLFSDPFQSPFEGPLKAAFSLTDSASFSSSEYTPLTEAFPMYAPELIETENGRNEGYEDAHKSSDSGESTVGTPSTPTAMRSISDITTSSNDDSSMAIDRKLITEEEIICTNFDYVSRVDVSQAPNESASNMLLSSTDPACKTITAFGEPSSMSIVQSQSSSRHFLATSDSRDPTIKEPSQELSQGSYDRTRSQGKRPRDAVDFSHAPTPKRMTLASQKKQHQKLASPFRSPLLSRSNPGNISTPDRPRARSSQLSPLSSIPRRDSDEDMPSTPVKDPARPVPATIPRSRALKPGSVARSLFGSAKATSQFKSPLASSTPSAPSRPRNTRNMQELERKVQFLKRAVKIKKDGDEGKLEQLVKKWREVGREAAWELWKIVRDNDEASDTPYPGTTSKSSSALSGNWGWASSSGSGHANGNWGWDESPSNETLANDGHDEELESPSKLERELYGSLRKKPTISRTSMLPPTPRGAYFEQRTVPRDFDTCDEASEVDQGREMEDEESHTPKPTKSLGTMLHQIGIAHETLGWDEDEGDFVDT